MKKHPFIAMAMTAGLFAGSAALAQPAAASASDCSGYENVRTLPARAGQTEVPFQYLIALKPGPIEVCLDGPDGTDYGLVLDQMVSGGTKTVATATGGGADKTLSYTGPISAYQVKILADTAGTYTVGVNLP
ncbi:hypothetical protein QQY24_30605 [Streptomyces sp. TG1A-8]|uniref:hypothetical protein n=1 Tax=Streptomyces sp. TG1A-8 TaxID=3051385 RepID=UPI00265C79CE|nr:hypothetical protein [Streptomyces sp. TG1A-8]MDO0929531.1 hypothetical protein [Streptomyces sp. TG1A-8]